MSETTPLLGSSSGRLLASRGLWRLGVLFTAAGIMVGAFGTHGLRNKPGMDADKMRAWETAAHYSIYNGLGLMLVSLHPRFSLHRFAGPAIALGGFIFSSSIIVKILDREKKRFSFLGPITPVGGAVMIAGYLSMLF